MKLSLRVDAEGEASEHYNPEQVAGRVSGYGGGEFQGSESFQNRGAPGGGFQGSESFQNRGAPEREFVVSEGSSSFQMPFLNAPLPLALDNQAHVDNQTSGQTELAPCSSAGQTEFPARSNVEKLFNRLFDERIMQFRCFYCLHV
jgi:hypothetical protein